MPKDNEVDEKVMPVAWRYWSAYHASQVNVLGPGRYEYTDEGQWHPDGAEPLYSAATVAELRAEVSALSHELDCVNANWQASMAHAKTLRARADAAERRVGELEADARRYRYLREKRDVLLCTGFFGNCCVNKTVADVDAAIDTLTGADPT